VREEFPAKIKEQAWEKSNGVCQNCSCELRVSYTHYDHIIPCGLGGGSILDNCQVLCRSCHMAKTASQDIPIIAKSKRIRRRHLGIRKPRVITAWRNFKGEIIRKPRER
jgi:hypothetical protein